MYSYTYDKKTGGILLNSSPTVFSKEPRPVYAPELDVLGFDKYWKYDKQTDTPYMWAEANNYYYRGQLVASLSGGNVYTAPIIQLAFECKEYKETPNGKTTEKVVCDVADKSTFKDKKGNVFTVVEPEPNGRQLERVNIETMVEANREMLDIIEQTTVKKILAIYTKYKKKLDCFHVAFSGGKDSCVLLDLVKKVLPKGSFVVVFGNTGMEFPDTLDIVEKTRQQCNKEEIPFYTAKSHLEPKDSWKLFGPPSRVLRWCCSVHKSTPQTLKMREITGKNNFVGLDFVGVRGQESAARSTYTYENYGMKQRNQHSHNSILEWTSAEIWLYVYANDVLINETYKKGNGRAGCLFCPMSSGPSDYLRYKSYPVEIDEFVSIIKTMNNWDEKKDIASYITDGGWDNRCSGRGIENNFLRFKESCQNGNVSFEITNPLSDRREWVKTFTTAIKYTVSETKTGYTVIVSEEALKNDPSFAKVFRQVFRKAAYCSGCRVCEANCKSGCIHFEMGKVKISKCQHCLECHKLPGGCLMYDSLKIPQGEKKMKAINCFDDHAPKTEWLVAFFANKANFITDNKLGPNQRTKFKRFLDNADLIDNTSFSPFATIISSLGWETDTAQGLVFINLVFKNPQIEWYVRNFDIAHSYSYANVVDMLLAIDVKEKAAKSIAKSYKRLVETPLGTVLHFGHVTNDGDLVRTKCTISDPRVVLYGLFKFAEKCNDYRQFTLATLLNDGIDRDGISPTRIFGLDRGDMTPMLLGLSAKYHDFINAAFTHDLEKITLAGDKSSQDVLNLFKGGV
jgi:phosphoadenosine phosphosulfate reductase